MVYDGRLTAGVSVLAALVEAGTFARAADALGLTPSGVSRAIARLEGRIGARLLNRTTRSMVLTEEGRRFYERVNPLLGGIEEAAVEAAGSSNTPRGRLRVNVDPFFARVILADRLERFLSQHPAVRLELIMRDQVGDLIADGFDLAVRFGEPPKGAFSVRKILDTPVLTVASPGYVTRAGAPAHPHEVAAHACILFHNAAEGRAFEWEVRRGAEVVAVPPPPRLLLSDVGAMLSACDAGSGIAQVLGLGAERLLAGGRLVQLLPDWGDERFPLFALFPSHQHRPAKVRAFLEFCQSCVEAPVPPRE